MFRLGLEQAGDLILTHAGHPGQFIGDGVDRVVEPLGVQSARISTQGVRHKVGFSRARS
jgi:hypothetical protein